MLHASGEERKRKIESHIATTSGQFMPWIDRGSTASASICSEIEQHHAAPAEVTSTVVGTICLA